MKYRYKERETNQTKKTVIKAKQIEKKNWKMG